MIVFASRARRIARRIRRIWMELDHAQRRLVEIQIELPDDRAEARTNVAIAELERSFRAGSAWATETSGHR
ncbi:MAG: hypothetical protein WAL63_01675 [Solirubrobacteraceae bacterium]